MNVNRGEGGVVIEEVVRFAPVTFQSFNGLASTSAVQPDIMSVMLSGLAAEEVVFQFARPEISVSLVMLANANDISVTWDTSQPFAPAVCRPSRLTIPVPYMK